MITLLAARPGTGKSLVALDLAHRIITGQAWPDGTVTSDAPAGATGRPVIYIDGENIPEVHNERAIAWGLPREQLYMLLADEEDILVDLSGQKYQELLAQMVFRLEPALVIVDSLGAVMGKGENAVEDVRALLGLISHVGEWAGFMAIMLLVPERELGVVALMNKSDQSQSAAFSNIGWNLARLAVGQPARDFPTDDFVTRNGRVILLGVVLLLALGAAWSARRLSRWRSDGVAEPPRWLVALFVAFAIVDALLAGYLLLVRLPETNDSIPLALRFQPDTGLLYVALLALTLGWGTSRTIWMLIVNRPPPASSSVQPSGLAG